MRALVRVAVGLFLGFLFGHLAAPPAPARAQEPEDEAAKIAALRVPARAQGDGPWARLVLRGATVVDGTGAPPFGPADIVIAGNRIEEVRTVGAPGLAIDPERRPPAGEGAQEIDASGMYVLPGFVDLHGHQHNEQEGQGVPATLIHKLWLAHGITTICDVGNWNLEWLLEHKDRSGRNEITAPRVLAYVVFGNGAEQPIRTPAAAREWVRMVKRKGADGIKFFGASPDVMRAALDEMKQQGLRGTAHHAQLNVTRMNVLDTARAGLTSMQHWYGLPEALFEDRRIQDYPADYNYQNEAHRFGEAGRLWRQAAAPGSERWRAVMDELLELDFTIVPTFVAYLASRDLMRQSRNEWHAIYTHPKLWDFYRPNRDAHGSYWFDWTSADEVAWRDNYRRWMLFVDEYKDRGGRVGLGSDSGYIFNLYGFGYIQEMELMLEAGFHPLEIFRSATLLGAEALGLERELGSIEAGKLADLVIVAENPLHNLKVLYGTGALRLDDHTGTVVRVGGVHTTIKDGVVYDARRLLQDVKDAVDAAKHDAGLPPSPMPLFIDTVYDPNPLPPPPAQSAPTPTGNGRP